MSRRVLPNQISFLKAGGGRETANELSEWGHTPPEIINKQPGDQEIDNDGKDEANVDRDLFK